MKEIIEMYKSYIEDCKEVSRIGYVHSSGDSSNGAMRDQEIVVVTKKKEEPSFIGFMNYLVKQQEDKTK